MTKPLTMSIIILPSSSQPKTAGIHLQHFHQHPQFIFFTFTLTSPLHSLWYRSIIVLFLAYLSPRAPNTSYSSPTLSTTPSTNVLSAGKTMPENSIHSITHHSLPSKASIDLNTSPSHRYHCCWCSLFNLFRHFSFPIPFKCVPADLLHPVFDIFHNYRRCNPNSPPHPATRPEYIPIFHTD